ncbi:unnamed protein product [Adineta ricciae]|uniref:LIM zinc-binding domain-containing protein n=1 Tax=Adineta ricciae TaxID=249248 RepID=A0A813NR77_ADIRI|nr:unnamed protein product [Adineta ricciae]CAF0930825.1 unnamed protein product [Adineta ricciae]
MSSTTTRASANDNASSSTYRVNYSEYVADITGSPKALRKLPTGGIGHHISPIHNPHPTRSNQSAQQQQTGTAMPHYGGGAEKCARCSKSVYLAEKKVGAGRSFHTSCFNCYSCKRKLDTAHLSEHKGEIYCKSCYTKQFGAHGLISGVTMSTEQTSSYGRRPSYGNDLDRSTETFQQLRQRSNSSENVFQGDFNSTRTNQRKNSVENLADSKYRRSPSPTAVQIPVEYKTNQPQRSNSKDETDRKNYSFEGERLSYGKTSTSALVDIPVVVQSKRSDSVIDRIELPANPTLDRQRSRSPSITSNDSYQRQSNLADDYSRLHITEDVSNRKIPTDRPLNAITTDNPLSTRNYSYHSSSTSSYETKYRSSDSNTNNNYEREQRSRDSSPIGGYISSSSTATTRTQRTVDSSRGSTSGYVPQHDYLNTQTSTNSSERRPPSPINDTRPMSGLEEFISKTNIAPSGSSTGSQFSALGALLPNARRRNDDYDDFED